MSYMYKLHFIIQNLWQIDATAMHQTLFKGSLIYVLNINEKSKPFDPIAAEKTTNYAPMLKHSALSQGFLIDSKLQQWNEFLLLKLLLKYICPYFFYFIVISPQKN